MSPAELIALAAPHGIDLQHVAGNASDTKGAARHRRRSPEERRDGRIHDTADGNGTRVYRAPAWTHAEAGMAATGVPRMPWLAACYSFAGDRSGYKELHRGLTTQAIRFATREGWPWQIQFLSGRNDYFIERLTELVLDAEGVPSAFTAAPQLYAIVMGVTQQTWDKPLLRYYSTVQGQYQRWLATARGMIARWVRNEEFTEHDISEVASATVSQ